MLTQPSYSHRIAIVVANGSLCHDGRSHHILADRHELQRCVDAAQDGDRIILQSRDSAGGKCNQSCDASVTSFSKFQTQVSEYSEYNEYSEEYRV